MSDKMAEPDKTPSRLDKGRFAAQLSPVARWIHREILSGYAHVGRAPSRPDLAGRTGLDVGAALEELLSVDLVVLDSNRELAASYPFSATPTTHKVTLPNGIEVFAMCAVDALGVSAMLDQPVTITSAEPGTGLPITIQVDRDHADWRPATAVVYAGESGDCHTSSAKRTCGYINFFTTAAAATAWSANHPHVTGTLLTQAEALTSSITEFGDLLHPFAAN